VAAKFCQNSACDAGRAFIPAPHRRFKIGGGRIAVAKDLGERQELGLIKHAQAAREHAIAREGDAEIASFGCVGHVWLNRVSLFLLKMMSISELGRGTAARLPLPVADEERLEEGLELIGDRDRILAGVARRQTDSAMPSVPLDSTIRRIT
jgi:hypothetical protein